MTFVRKDPFQCKCLLPLMFFWVHKWVKKNKKTSLLWVGLQICLCRARSGSKSFSCFLFLDLQLHVPLLGNTLPANIIRKHWKLITLVWHLRWRALPTAEYVRMIEQPVSLYHSKHASLASGLICASLGVGYWAINGHENYSNISNMSPWRGRKEFTVVGGQWHSLTGIS